MAERELRTKRAAIKAQLTRIESWMSENDTNTTTIIEINVRLQRLEVLFVDFNNIQHEIEMMHEEDEEVETESTYRDNIEKSFYNSKSIGQALIESLKSREDPDRVVTLSSTHIEKNSDEIENALKSMIEHQAALTSMIRESITPALQRTIDNTSTGTSENTTATNKIRLEAAQIPKFDGHFKDWKAFFDTFNFLVHNNNSLSNCQKYIEIKKALTGDAASIFKNLEISDANYIEAYNELVRIYDRDDFIIESHLENIHNLAKIERATSENLRKLSSTFNESVRGLKALKIPVETWDEVLIFIFCKKLDNESLLLWRRERSKLETSDINLEQLLEFIQNRIYELTNIREKTNAYNSNTNNIKRQAFQITASTCLFCKSNHYLQQCQDFLNMSLQQKRDFVKQNNLCFNCLRQNHQIKSCKSQSSCKICEKRHHTVLHTHNENQTIQSPKQPHKENRETKAFNSQNNESSTSAALVGTINSKEMVSILPTAVILVKNVYDEYVPCRALLDSGSQVTLISEALLQKLKIKRYQSRISINGIGEDSSSSIQRCRGKTLLNIKSRLNETSIEAMAYVLPKLSSNIPSESLSVKMNRELKNLQMADPHYNQSRKIDVLLGCDVFFNILENEKRDFGPEYPLAIKTSFGWVFSGKAKNQIEGNEIVQTFHSCIDIDENLKKFWEIENISTIEEYTTEEVMAEKHYVENTIRDEDGRYIVRLPFKENPELLGDSSKNAYYRLLALERKFKSNQTLFESYQEFVKEYEQMNQQQIDTTHQNQCFYLPHHAVIKDSSSTTKLRVVFDGSKETSSGFSLNNILLVGPTIQPDLMSILLKFRVGKFGYSADIAKMYRQVLLHNEDRKYQKILWKTPEDKNIYEYQLNTVTYGTASAPFLAIRTLNKLAQDEKHNYPTGAEKLISKFYVDDFLDSSDSLDESLVVKEEITNILQSGGFELRKWASNSNKFLSTIEENFREVSFPLNLNKDQTIKTLGLNWDPANDNFIFKINLSSDIEPTKRTILSEVSKLFDPLGWLSPCIILSKILIQQLWIKSLKWDDPVPENLKQHWLKIKEKIPHLSNVKIPRWTSTSKSSKIQLCGFSDASQSAYAAVIYLRVLNEDSINVHLIASKTKVAPTNTLSIARLELSAAHLLSKLMQKIKKEMNLENVQTMAFTNSTKVLAWLKEIPRKWSTFVGNRTSEILSTLPYKHWSHVKSNNNPADCASRGMFGDEIINNSLWWTGPKFLHEPTFRFQNTIDVNFTVDEERRKVLCQVQTDSNQHIILHKYSSLTKAKRIMAWCLRFYYNSSKKHIIKEPELSSDEMQAAFENLIKYAQLSEFEQEINLILRNKELPSSSKLLGLKPFLDNKKLLRVGGRIQRAQMPYDTIHSIILNKQCQLSKLIIAEYHMKYFHAGTQFLLSVINSRFWIFGLRTSINNFIRRCVHCNKYKARACQQQMGILPESRLQPSKAFSNSGVDYAGPFEVKSWRGRGAKSLKCYICLFVCMTTRALHLELVSDLTTDTFIAALNRFMSRRGVCLQFYSDNGRNFTGAAKKLNEIQQFFIQNGNTITKNLASQQITWNFIPPYTPHFGGSWESGVKSVKKHLKSVYNSSLTYEEMTTLLCQIEGILNSRPLAPKTNDVDDLEPLTPGHFLTQSIIILPPEINFLDTNTTYLKRWQYVTKLHQQFWARWSHEYLITLQVRKKWKTISKNLKANDLVVILDKNLPPCKWRLGRVISTQAGNDNLVRVVTLKTQDGVIERSINKLCILLSEEETSS